MPSAVCCPFPATHRPPYSKLTQRHTALRCRPDAKNALYQDVVRKGDQLLNKVQKLSRVIDVE